MRSRMATVAALVLVATGVALLVVGGDIRPGDDAPLEIGNWPHELELLAGMAVAVIAVVSRPARAPAGWAILLVSAVVAALGPTDVLSFYDGDGLAMALGAACLVALWLVVTGRRTRPEWSRDLLRRLLAYLTLAVVVLPGVVGAGAAVSCSLADDDELCELPGLMLGAPVALMVWLILVFVGELLALRRRYGAR